jgi:hypothetical protein
MENFGSHKTIIKAKMFLQRINLKDPSHIAVFTKLRNDSLRVDVISNSYNG